MWPTSSPSSACATAPRPSSPPTRPPWSPPATDQGPHLPDGGPSHRRARPVAAPLGSAAALLGVVLQAEGEGDALARDVDVENLDPDDVAGLDDLARVGDERLGHRRDVDQAVLMDADVDEGAEGRDVGHDA